MADDRIKSATLQINQMVSVDPNNQGRKVEGNSNRVVRVELSEDLALDVIADIKGPDVDPETYRSKNQKFYMDLWLSKRAHAALRGKDIPALVDSKFYLTWAGKELFTRRSGDEGSDKRLIGTLLDATYNKFNLPDVYESVKDNRGKQSSRVTAGSNAAVTTQVAAAIAALQD